MSQPGTAITASRNWVHYRAAAEMQMEVLETVHDRQGVRDRRRCVAGRQSLLSTPGVYYSRRWRARHGTTTLWVRRRPQPPDQGAVSDSVACSQPTSTGDFGNAKQLS